ncbi:MAG: ABC transporter permease [Nocardioidaceae bacterium]|jgi:ABC-type transport system involved in multi-copper enzyme maturation permease subunit|nr:ABC transporter permease [Nocardioidaceae bacterium]
MSTATAPTPYAPAPGTAPKPSLVRLVTVELRKLVDTRAGFWLLASIAILVVLASASVMIWAPDSAITYDVFMQAAGYPIGFLLPVLAILSVTSEWSQRTGLVTFTMEPRRIRTLLAKLVATVIAAVAAVVVSLALAAVANVLGAAVNGVDTVWNNGASEIFDWTLLQLLGLLLGFAFATLFRISAVAIVVYYAYNLVISGLLSVLAAFQEWFADIQGWVDFSFAQIPLTTHSMDGEAWAQLATSGTIWLLLPLAVGTWLVLRAEVK